MTLHRFVACLFALSLSFAGCGGSDAETESADPEMATGGEDMDELMEEAADDSEDADLDEDVDDAAEDAVDATDDLGDEDY